jgi:hypothetical protein
MAQRLQNKVEHKDMGLLLQNMKSHIFCNDCESIQHNVMQGYLLPNMNVTKKVDPLRIQKLTTNAMWHPRD